MFDDLVAAGYTCSRWQRCGGSSPDGRAGARLGERLKARSAVLATAESCTGGWAAQVVTSVAGSSAWFDRGFVTYSDAAKQELLGVRAETLRQPRRGKRRDGP